ncbi:MAG: polysaccharide biosynthesis protein [Firmicutes bacterium]|jgi:stage V sporulation protein B|nr:polysaccharide biosynthesis protein [Bacillota bacterium]
MPEQKSKSFVLNTIILTLAGGFARVLGAVYRIFLTRIIGDEGIGLYQMAYNLALLFMTVGMTGLPLAISKMVAEKTALRDEKSVHKILKLSLLVSAILGIALAAVLGAGADFWANQNLKEPRALGPLMAIAPAVLFVFLMAPLRGYFQGRQEMLPRAISDAGEQLVRVAMILSLAFMFMGNGIAAAATGAALGVSIGSMAAFFYLLLLYLKRRSGQGEESPVIGIIGGPKEEGSLSLLKRLTVLAVPVTLGSLIWPMMQFVDTLFITARLQAAGFSASEATALFGRYSGQAGPLINMPSILTVAVVASLIPAITEAMTQGLTKTMQQRANLALKLSMFIALPAAAGLNLLSQPVATILYGSNAAADIIGVYSWVILFLLMYQTSTGILQGIDSIRIPVLSMVVGIAVKGFFTFWLVGIAEINIFGAALATLAGFSLAVTINLFYVYRHTRMPADLRGLVIAPVISSALMGVAVYFAYKLLQAKFTSPLLPTAVAVLLGIIIYAIVLLLSGGLSKEELKSIPKIGPVLAKRMK